MKTATHPPARTARASRSGRPVRRSRAEQLATTRRELVQAGLRVVAERGFAAATTAAIAQACGKAHGTVFVHFKTRDALVAELVEEVGRAITERLADIPTETTGVAEVLDAHLAALAAHEVLYARLLRDATSLPAAARARVFALQSGIAWRLRHAHARDVSARKVRAMDPVALGNTWIALTNHYLMNRDLFAPGASVIAARGAELRAQLLAHPASLILRPAFTHEEIAMSDTLCPSCGSCGFPMRKPEDFAGGRTDSAYCSTCGDDKGRLKPFKAVLQANADYFAREQGIDPEAARQMARALLVTMPAWKGRA